MFSKKYLKIVLEALDIYDKNEISRISIKNKKFGVTVSDSSPRVRPVHSVSVERVSSIDSPVKIETSSKDQRVGKEESTNLHEVKSPMAGSFYSRPNPNSEPFVKKGDVVQEDTVVCLIEAMKMFNEVKAGVNGVIEEIKVKDGELVNQGDVLFLIKK